MTHSPDTIWRTVFLRWFRQPTLFGAAFVLLTSPLRADVVVFSQPLDPSRQHGLSDLNRTVQGADNFSFLQPTTLSSLGWWGSYNSSTAEPDDFRIRFFSDSGGGTPANNPFLDAAPIALTRMDTGMPSPSGRPTFRYSAELPPGIALNGATPYYLSLVNRTISGWNWAGDGGNGNYSRKVEGESWRSDSISSNRAFELRNVPEPSGLVILAGLLVPFAVTHLTARRRRFGSRRYDRGEGSTKRQC